MPELCVREILSALTPHRWRGSAVLDAICRTFGHRRLVLPEADPEALFPGFDGAPVQVTALARGWPSTWLIDQVVLAKIVVALRPHSVLEVGSFRGYTARLLAENAGEEARVVALDVDPRHGAAYLGTPVEQRITRLVGKLGCWAQLDCPCPAFDLIFIDSDHREAGVREDSLAALELLTDGGVIVWHDYKDFGWLDGSNRVPEVLADLARSLPIYAIPGSSLAVFGKRWEQAWAANPVTQDPNPWTTSRLKG